MNKGGTRGLQTVLKLAQLRQRQAAEQLGHMTRAEAEQRLQIQQLKGYQDDYRQQFSGQSGAVVSIHQLQNFQAFFQQLEQAVEVQGERLVLAEQQCQQAREEWQQRYLYEKNLAQLLEKRELERSREHEKRLQQQMDDRQLRRQT